MRLRIPKPEPGTVWGVREAARQLGVDASVIRYQLGKGKIVRAGDGVDARSAWGWATGYKPHKDNVKRRVRGKTLAEGVAGGRPGASAVGRPRMGEAPNSNGVHANSNGVHAISRGIGSDSRGTPATARKGGKGAAPPAMDTREWVRQFYAHQTQLMGGELHPKTKGKYDQVFNRFVVAFPTVPMDPVEGRERIVVWIHGLHNSITGARMADGSKATFHKTISAFYNWMEREKRLIGPSLEHTSLPGMPAGKKVVYADEVRLVLNCVRDHTEYTLALLFAQTGARLLEVCTIRPECLQPYWVHTWDKRTRANLTGYRPLFLPDETFAAVQQEFKVYGELMVRGRPLSGPPIQVNDQTGRALPGPKLATRLNDPETYRVNPKPWAGDAVSDTMKRLMIEAGVYERGKLAHAFRRAFQSAWLKNGGSEAYMPLVMGHVNKSNMNTLYLHDQNDAIAAEVRKYAPRGFLAASGQPEQAAIRTGPASAISEAIIPARPDPEGWLDTRHVKAAVAAGSRA